MATDWASKFDPKNQKHALSPTIHVLPPKPKPNPKPKTPKISAAGQKAMKQILVNARAAAKGDSEGWGDCYLYVYTKYMQPTGYGKITSGNDPVPGSYGSVAAQFAEYANGHLEALGLQRLSIDSPYDAPAGAIVVVAAGSPGTSSNASHLARHPDWKSHPDWPGDISVATGGDVFYNDHLTEQYGGRAGWDKAHKAGTAKLLGAYVPK